MTLRKLHGISAIFLVAFVLIHITNHLVFLE